RLAMKRILGWKRAHRSSTNGGISGCWFACYNDSRYVVLFEEHFESFNTFRPAQPQCLCGLQSGEVTINGNNGDRLWALRSLDMGSE
ncbi:hypothetical protein, partial [Hydrogenophaga sp.]|uniref:hypothetical protein n=1 Tax=Hydrogenophaga sp. TaxID=1904254 RepID=UPI003AF978D8